MGERRTKKREIQRDTCLHFLEGADRRSINQLTLKKMTIRSLLRRLHSVSGVVCGFFSLVRYTAASADR